MRSSLVGMGAAAMLCLAIGARPAAAEFDWDKRVEAAKTKAIEYLFSRQMTKMRIVLEGNTFQDIDAEWKDVSIVKGTQTAKIKGQTFDKVVAILPPGWFDDEPGPDNFHAMQVGGKSSLVTLALLSAGVNPKVEPKMLKAIESVTYLHTAKLLPADIGAGAKADKKALSPGAYGMYAIGIHASALEAAFRIYRTGPLGGDIRKALDFVGIKELQDGYSADAGYRYPLQWYKNKGDTDLSVTQYGILGLWACARADVELNDRVWKHFNQYLLEIQTREGGWGYTPNENAKPTMNAAGIASLFVMMDQVHTKNRGLKGPDITPFSNDPLLLRTVQGLDRALDYWGRTFAPQNDGYFMYGTERVGVAAGFKYFGQHDWYKEGAELLLKTQGGNGAWNGAWGGPACNTSWDLMFLVFGGAPILINKLEYGPKGDWTWNNYPRDAANLVRWYSKEYETLVNWQIIQLDASKENDLMDAPFLYISGHKDVNFTDTEVDIMKRYVEKGGTLLCIANGHRREFVNAIVKLGQRMYPPERFPECQFTALPKTHPIYSTLKPGTDGALLRLPIWHMSNGHRSFAFLIPEDINHLWSTNRWAGRDTRHAFTLMAILRNYATEKATVLPGKIRPPVTDGWAPYTGPAKPPIKIGVVTYASLGKVQMQSVAGKDPVGPVAVKSDWAAAPIAWRAYNEWFQHVSGHAIQESRGISLTDPGLNDYDVLHLTGHYAFTLSKEETAALKSYLEKGGSILVDCVGGVNSEFNQSALQILKEMFPNGVDRLNRNSAVVTGKPGGMADLTEGDASRQLKLNNPSVRGPADMMRALTINGRTAGIIAPCDLSLAISGQTCWERVGFSYKTSRQFVANFLMQAKENRAAPVAAGGGN